MLEKLTRETELCHLYINSKIPVYMNDGSMIFSLVYNIVCQTAIIAMQFQLYLSNYLSVLLVQLLIVFGKWGTFIISHSYCTFQNFQCYVAALASSAALSGRVPSS